MRLYHVLTRGLGSLGLLVLLSINLSAAFDRMVVFGDSLSDNGNQAISIGGLGWRNYDPLRFTSGPTTTPASATTGLTVEYLNTLFGLEPLTPSILGGSNYAWAGASTGRATLDLANGISPGTGTQVATYLAGHSSASSNSLYVFWAGGNDLFTGAFTIGAHNAATLAIGNLKMEITSLLDAGAKNILWINLSDLSRTLVGASLGPDLGGQLHEASLYFNSEWSLALQQFEVLYPDANFLRGDFFAASNLLFSDPEAYGITNLTDPAQGLVGVNPDGYLFWDTLHPTTKGHAVFADLIYQQLQAAPVPEPSGSAYFGLAVLALVGHRVYSTRRRKSERSANQG